LAAGILGRLASQAPADAGRRRLRLRRRPSRPLRLAATSTDAAQAWLKRRWAQLHRLVYPAALLTLVHWIFVHNNLAAALAHFAPLAVLEALRIAKTNKRQKSSAAREPHGATRERTPS
jgi:hypothetical protein